MYFLSSIKQIWSFKQFAFDPVLCPKETVTTIFTNGKRKSLPDHRKQKSKNFVLRLSSIISCVHRANADSRNQRVKIIWDHFTGTSFHS
ncbi:hypothetical protein EUGRSUZ_H01989 [Eucalyptus grandis]|uniref:Uncharacterized protein n=2 Tax=Eucalyptus grandis TaxID=71139 RepID=A0ACC3JQ22_EUCGR|nr:hypothetical protein EUGRSUZ_H01989 [Eucalyptus grandis]